MEIGHYEGYSPTFAITASKDLANVVDLNFRVLDTRDEGLILTLGISRDFGAGAKFRRPDYLALFNVW